MPTMSFVGSIAANNGLSNIMGISYFTVQRIRQGLMLLDAGLVIAAAIGVFVSLFTNNGLYLYVYRVCQPMWCLVGLHAFAIVYAALWAWQVLDACSSAIEQNELARLSRMFRKKPERKREEPAVK